MNVFTFMVTIVTIIGQATTNNGKLYFSFNYSKNVNYITNVYYSPRALIIYKCLNYAMAN